MLDIFLCLISSAAAATIEGKMSKTLKKILKKVAIEAHEQLAVADAKLGNAIKVWDILLTCTVFQWNLILIQWNLIEIDWSNWLITSECEC